MCQDRKVKLNCIKILNITNLYHFRWMNIFASSSDLLKSFTLKVTDRNYEVLASFVLRTKIPIRNVLFLNINFEGKNHCNDFILMIVKLLKKSLEIIHFENFKIHDIFGFCFKMFIDLDFLTSISFKACTIINYNKFQLPPPMNSLKSVTLDSSDEGNIRFILKNSIRHLKIIKAN